MSKSILLALASAAVLTACNSTTDLERAALGGAGGAVAGEIFFDEPIIGAAVGAGAGALADDF